MWRYAAGLLAVSVLAASVVGPASAAAQTDGQWWHIQWRMDEVWPISDGSGVTVAVLDTGVDASVPELAGAVVPGADFIGRGTDGTVDVDDPGHGTAMAVLIAGRDVRGFRGAASGATILPVTVITRDKEALTGEEASDRSARGIRFATENGAHVINMSVAALGDFHSPDWCPDELVEAVRYAASHDVIVVASSGNLQDGIDEADRDPVLGEHGAHGLNTPTQPGPTIGAGHAVVLVLGDEPNHRFAGRSSSAAKKVDAALRISFARRSSAFSRRNRASSAA